LQEEHKMVKHKRKGKHISYLHDKCINNNTDPHHILEKRCTFIHKNLLKIDK